MKQIFHEYTQIKNKETEVGHIRSPFMFSVAASHSEIVSKKSHSSNIHKNVQLILYTFFQFCILSQNVSMNTFLD
jgi:hypothetical protein